MRKTLTSIANRVPMTNLALPLALTLAIGVGACARADGADEFRDGVPTHEDVTLALPGGGTQQSALTASGSNVTVTQGALLGATADMYTLTRDITVMVNTGTVAVLTLVKTITEFPPTSVGASVAVWGPHTEPLSPNTWKLTVTRLAPGEFSYEMKAKPKTADDSAYLLILSGHHNLANPGVHRHANLPAYGSGDFVLDWDNAHMLPEHDTNVGKASFVYSRQNPLSDVDIGVTFTQVLDKDTGMLIDAKYDYASTPGAGGSFQFRVIKDAITTTPALETLTVRSRWQETGAGRSDVNFSGGDLGATVATANECWDTNFLSVFQTNSYNDPAKMWGDVASCVFPAADYASF
jgi:hypothetical protein